MQDCFIGFQGRRRQEKDEEKGEDNVGSVQGKIFFSYGMIGGKGLKWIVVHQERKRIRVSN